MEELLLQIAAGRAFEIKTGAVAALRTIIIPGSFKCEISAKIPSRFISFSMIFMETT